MRLIKYIIKDHNHVFCDDFFFFFCVPHKPREEYIVLWKKLVNLKMKIAPAKVIEQ